MESILYWAQLLLLSIDLSWSMVDKPNDIHWENDFLFDSRYQMQTASKLGLEFVSLSLS